MTNPVNGNRDIDILLREHGESWRDANQHRPGINWEEVTAPRRSHIWLAVAAAVVTAAAIVVPLAVVSGDHAHKRAIPAHPPLRITLAQRGAPDGFFAIEGRSIYHVSPDDNTGIGPGGGRPIALGSAPRGDLTYFAAAAPNCRTAISTVAHRLTRRKVERLVFADVTTIAGGEPRSAMAGQAMAVSPDGRKLALVATRPSGRYARPCDGPPQLVVLDLQTRQARRWSAPSRIRLIGSLQWAPNSRDLAYVTSGIHTQDGTRVLNTSAPGSSAVAPPVVFPQFRGDGSAYGPVFWWQNQLVVQDGQSLRLVSSAGQPGQVVATGLPPQSMHTMSSDPTGEHLLMSDGSTTFRWDRGVLTVVDPPVGARKSWIQPSW